ncbi:MAG: Trm112 family protein [Myxococcota bacterium]
MSERLRALLVCPVCKGDLDDVPDGLRCPADRLVYPIVDGVPWMLPERAKRS